MNSFSHKKVNNFVEASCWSDDIKKFGLYNLDNWHYADLPYVQSGPQRNYTFIDYDAHGTLVLTL
jgi:hypothetical protein